MKIFTAIFYGMLCEMRCFMRVKKAFFFSFIFPIFLYLVFVLIWGNGSPEYSYFLLTGIIAITTVSNSMMAIGDVIVKYTENGLLREFKTMTYNFNYHVASLVMSRLVMLLAATAVLLAFAVLFNHLSFTISDLCRIVCGIFFGMILFSLIGVLLGEFVESKKSDNTVMNFLFYIFIFVSDAFYPASTMNPVLGYIFVFNPITPMLNIMRGIGFYWPGVIWIVALAMAQIIGFKYLRLKR